jgi:hypothetical protein
MDEFHNVTEIIDGDDQQTVRREGDYWTIIYEKKVLRMKDSNGVRHLAYLLLHPHESIGAVEIERNTGRIAERGSDPVSRERARVNVTRSLSIVLQRITEHHPALGRHLKSTVRTGMFCTYTPDPRVRTVWES